MTNLKAPFPYFGRKRCVADAVWQRFGDVNNYVEPFAGSLAVLLARPNPKQFETVNDKDGYVSNFWRAVQSDPEAVIEAASSPVHETDVNAWHKHLHRNRISFTERLMDDPRFYDTEFAGRWAWGLCAWIGSGFAQNENEQIPNIQGDGGKGVLAKTYNPAEAIMPLCYRLSNTRVTCGGWQRVLTSATLNSSQTAVFLDPPYGEGNMDYAAGGNTTTLSQEVAAWAREHGDQYRIAYCGYTGSVEMPNSWEAYFWKARGGYGNMGDGEARKNAERECVWFSPRCLKVGRTLFD